MSDFLEECVNDLGLRYKRKKRIQDATIPSSKEKQENKPPQQLVKEKQIPSKKPLLVDLKKSLEKFDNFPKKIEKNSKPIESIPEINIEDLQNIEYPAKIILPLAKKANFYNNEIFPELRWLNLIKDAATLEFERVQNSFKKFPKFLNEC